MACSITTVAAAATATAAGFQPFSFQFHVCKVIPKSKHPQTKITKTHLPISLPNPKTLLKIPSFQTTPSTHLTLLSSTELSKEDKPTQQQQEEEGEGEEGKEVEKGRLEERFVVLNTGVYECRSCGYKYNKAVGDPSYPNTSRVRLREASRRLEVPNLLGFKVFFVSKSVEIAGFARNQQFGFGGNTLTSGQKAVLIYGSMLLFILLFPSGYFLG